MRIGSLFTGIGGLDLGLERAGMTVAWQVESDPWCQQILAKHWPHVAHYGDIHTVDPSDLEPVDLICGGFPCQPVSLAGLRKGVDDERWLWPEMHRIVSHLRPRWVVVENTPGLLASWGGFGDVLGDLAACGYDAEWESVPAAAVGAPHRRDRVFVVAYPHSVTLRVPAFGVLGDCPPVPGDDGEDGAVSDPVGVGHVEQGVSAGPWDGSGPVDVGGEGTPVSDSGRLGGGWWGGEPGEPADPFATPQGHGWWRVEPDVGRVVHGVPRGLDRRRRIRGLGNAVVPQVAEWVGQQIIRVEGVTP